MSSSVSTRKDRAYWAWEAEYNKHRPTEPDEDERWQELVRYAEEMLREAFDAGYEACKEDVTLL